jgi:hypothetical protein
MRMQHGDSDAVSHANLFKPHGYEVRRQTATAGVNVSMAPGSVRLPDDVGDFYRVHEGRAELLDATLKKHISSLEAKCRDREKDVRRADTTRHVNSDVAAQEES